jgi:hypothetical protein
MTTVQLIVILEYQGARSTTTLTRPWSEPLLAILNAVLAERGLPGASQLTGQYWMIRFENRFLRLDVTLAQALAGFEGRPSITLEILQAGGGDRPSKIDRIAETVESGVDLKPDAPEKGHSTKHPVVSKSDEAAAADILADESSAVNLGSSAPAGHSPFHTDQDLDLGPLPAAAGSDSAAGLGDVMAMEEEVEVSEPEEAGEVLCQELALEEEEVEESSPRKSRARAATVPLGRSAAGIAAARKVDRHATVRYYHRMNPERVYPLLVVIAEKTLREIVQAGVSQEASRRFQVAKGSVVEIEPILPGCACYPPKERVRIRAGEVTATFWVIPQVLGKLTQPRVVLRQDHHVLADIPLTITVVKKTLAVVMGVLSLFLPFLSVLLKHFNLDFESQLKSDFSLYARVADFTLSSLSPEALAGMLLTATGGFYLWSRPRWRDLFWDIVPATAQGLFQAALDVIQKGDEKRGGEMIAALLKTHPTFQPAWLYFAEWHYTLKDYQSALECFEKALALGNAEAGHYLHGSHSASKLRRDARALEILQEAQRALPPSRHTGLMWYNMGCYTIRLGNLDEGIDYLQKAITAGYVNGKQYRSDPDLKPVRPRADFQQLLARLG